MKTWKHIREDNRKTICSCISHNKKLIEISKIINYDPRAISKEVKRNRYIKSCFYEKFDEKGINLST